MATTEPQKWSATLGANADVNSLPATTPAGSGRASTSGLFPQVTQKPLDEGGIAPERADFNALFKYLGDYIYYVMQGGIFSYLSTYAYTAGNLATFSGAVYECIAANGPGNVHAPTDAAYWRKLATLQDIPPAATVNDGQLTISVNGTQVATFTANQAGNSTANISVPAAPTVGDGTITLHVAGSPSGSFTTNQTSNSIINVNKASDTAYGVVKVGAGITVSDGVISCTGGGGGGGGSGNWPPIVFRAINDYSNGSSAIDSAMRAAGYWRCGYAITTWGGYGTGGSGYTSYIAYAPAGYTVTQLDIDIAGDVGHAYGLDPTYSGSNPISTAGCWGWYHCPTPATANRNELQKPTAGMTSASEYALPTP